MIVPFTIGCPPVEPIKFWMEIDQQNRCDAALMQYMQQRQAPEPEVLSLMAKVLRLGDFAVDAGANVGFFTLFMSRLVGPGGKVLAIEPGANNLPKLYENLKLNKIANVEVLAKALRIGSEPQILYLCADGGLNSMTEHEDTETRQEVDAVWLSDAFENAPRLLKIDIEGAEYRVFQTVWPYNRPNFIVSEMNDKALARFGDTPYALRQAMHQRQYDMFLLHPDGALPTLVPPGTNFIPTRENTNVLFSTIDDVGKAWSEVKG